MRRAVLWSVVVTVGGLGWCWATTVQAQQGPVAVCEDQKAVLQYELNVTDMELRRVRRTLAEELRQAIQRAERAEQTLAQKEKPAVPVPKAE